MVVNNKGIKMCRTIAVDLIVAFSAALFLTQWGAYLIFVYLNGGVVNVWLAILMTIIGMVGALIIVTRPICIKIERNQFLTIYSLLGFSHINYELPKDIISAEWIMRGAVLQLTFRNGKRYKFSTHSFFGLRNVFDKMG